jgi:hypothetical protein
MTARPTARAQLAAIAAAVSLAGCGPPPPQAPPSQAKKLDASTSDLSTECGLAYQVTAFPGDHRKDLANLETQAMASARSLASVYHRNPDWIYQGATVGQIVTDALSMLHACGLTQAERTLRRATSRV